MQGLERETHSFKIPLHPSKTTYAITIVAALFTSRCERILTGIKNTAQAFNQAQIVNEENWMPQQAIAPILVTPKPVSDTSQLTSIELQKTDKQREIDRIVAKFHEHFTFWQKRRFVSNVGFCFEGTGPKLSEYMNGLCPEVKQSAQEFADIVVRSSDQDGDYAAAAMRGRYKKIVEECEEMVGKPLPANRRRLEALQFLKNEKKRKRLKPEILERLEQWEKFESLATNTAIGAAHESLLTIPH